MPWRELYDNPATDTSALPDRVPEEKLYGVMERICTNFDLQAYSNHRTEWEALPNKMVELFLQTVISSMSTSSPTRASPCDVLAVVLATGGGVINDHQELFRAGASEFSVTIHQPQSLEEYIHLFGTYPETGHYRIPFSYLLIPSAMLYVWGLPALPMPGRAATAASEMRDNQDTVQEYRAMVLGFRQMQLSYQKTAEFFLCNEGAAYVRLLNPNVAPLDHVKIVVEEMYKCTINALKRFNPGSIAHYHKMSKHTQIEAVFNMMVQCIDMPDVKDSVKTQVLQAQLVTHKDLKLLSEKHRNLDTEEEDIDCEYSQPSSQNSIGGTPMRSGAPSGHATPPVAGQGPVPPGMPRSTLSSRGGSRPGTADAAAAAARLQAEMAAGGGAAAAARALAAQLASQAADGESAAMERDGDPADLFEQ